MKVHHVMSTSIVTVTPKAKFRELWKAIFKKQVHALPVVNEEKKIIGIISEEDLLRLLYPDYRDLVNDFVRARDFEEMEEKLHDLVDLEASHVMCSRVIFTRPDTPLMRALSRMLVRGVRQLPVISHNNQLIGMVSKGDIFDALFKRHLRLVKRKK